jgi:uncharacterized protein YceH (UPF0502 family)
MATPEYYPMSLNAVVNAQPEVEPRPVVHYDDDVVDQRWNRCEISGWRW